MVSILIESGEPWNEASQGYIQDFEVGGGGEFQSLALTWRMCFNMSLLGGSECLKIDTLRLILRHSGGTYRRISL